MLSKILSEKDMEIHKFVNNLEVKLQEKEGLLAELKAQKEELQSDFKYNLSLLRERDQELVELEIILQEKDTEILQRDAEIKKLKGKLSEEEEKTKDLKNYLKEQEEFHSMNFKNTEKDFQERFYTRDKQELVFKERIQELSNLLKEKEEELLQEIQKNSSRQKNISEKKLLEIINVRASFQEKISELQDVITKHGIIANEKECLLHDLTLQNDTKYRKIISLEEKIVEFETSKKDSEEERRQLVTEVSQLQNRIDEIEQEMKECLKNFELKEQENAKNVQELDDIISGLSQRNEFLKKEFTDRISLLEEELKELVLENEILFVKLDQEKSIKESEKEMYLKNQDCISGDLQAKTNELHDLKNEKMSLESDFKRKSEQLDKVNKHLKDLEIENQELRRRFNLDEIGWNKKLNEMKEKAIMTEMQDRQKEIELNKLRKYAEDIEKEKLELLKEIQELNEKEAMDDANNLKVLELEATNEQLSSIIHQMRIDMENLQQKFQVSQEKDDNSVSHEIGSKDDIYKQNNSMKIEISDLQARLKKLTMEKNRLVDISNSVRSHIRNWKEAQENRHDRSTQTIIVLNAVENKDSSISRNQKVLIRQSDKETASQNKSRTKLTKPNNIVKPNSGELPEKFQASMQNRALGIRNWNNIHD